MSKPQRPAHSFHQSSMHTSRLDRKTSVVKSTPSNLEERAQYLSLGFCHFFDDGIAPSTLIDELNDLSRTDENWQAKQDKMFWDDEG